MSLTTISELPNEFDPLVFDEGLKRIPAFLRNADKARERELASGNGEFFFIVAEQWIEQASLLYFFQRSPTEILESAESGLNDFVKSLELGYSVNPLTALLFFSVAVVIDNRPMARFIATAPEAILGFLDDPDSPVPVSVQIVFELLVNQDHKVHHDLEYLHSLLFELPYEIEYKLVKPELDNLYHLIASLVDQDESAFNKNLHDRCRIRIESLNRDLDEFDIPPLIDWTALGLIQFARDRKIKTNISHVYFPVELLDMQINP